MEKMLRRDMEILRGGEQLPQLAVLVVLAADERNEPPFLALAEKVVEKFVRLLSSPVLDATVFWHVDEVEVHGFAEIERGERLFGNLLPSDFVRNAESVGVEIPSKVIRLVYVEAQNVVCIKFPYDDVGRGILTACGDEDHGLKSVDYR